MPESMIPRRTEKTRSTAVTTFSVSTASSATMLVRRFVASDVLVILAESSVPPMRESDWLAESDEVVLLNTGTGLIYPETMR
jgi:hypothetical protein